MSTVRVARATWIQTIVGFLPWALLASPTFAGVIHVPADYPTIQAAIVAAQAGDHVLVAPGTFHEAIDFLGKDIVVESEAGRDVTIIDATGLGTSAVSMGGMDGRLHGFTVSGGVGGIDMGSGTAVDCRITANQGFGVSAENGFVEHCDIVGNDGDGAALYGGHLQSCLIDSNNGSGVFIRYDINGGGGTIDACTVSRNVSGIYATSSSVSGVYAATIASNCVIADNGTAFSYAAFFFSLAFADTIGLFNDCVIFGNDVYLYGTDYTLVFGSIDGSILVNSAVHTFAAGVQSSWCDLPGGAALGDGNIDADPLFVDPAAHDFHLQPGSPCINTGNPAGSLDPDGSPPDMGAYAYHPWADLGGGVGGTWGLPVLVMNGPLTANTKTTWSLSHARPDTSFMLVVGFSEAGVLFQGGILWPMPDALITGLSFDALGAAAGSGRWPTGAPSGTGIWMQAWFEDSGAPAGFAGSNGVRGITP